tara:strand:+ start:3861 stop:4265 length:405 start_codon:yes stop_codon:yes gene_type:complete
MSLLRKSYYVTYALIPGSYAITTLYDKFGNVLSETQSDIEEGAKNLALDLRDKAILEGSELIDDISEVTLDVANAALDIIEGAGLAVISAGENMFDYTYSKVAPHRVEAVTALTALTVYLTTAVIVFKKIRGAN